MMRARILLAALVCGGALFFAVAAQASGATPSAATCTLSGDDVGAIAFDPNNPKIMLIGARADGGEIFRSTDGGATFTRIQVGTNVESFRSIAFDPANSTHVLAFSTDYEQSLHGAVYLSTNRGLAWKRLKNQPLPAGSSGPLGRGRGVMFDHLGTTIIAADYRNGIFRSGNLGASWTNTLPHARVYALAADPQQTNTLWTSGFDENFKAVLWKSADFGKSWTKVKVGILNQDYGPLINVITVLPGGGTILFGWTGSDAKGNPNGGVIVSRNGGASWANAVKGLSADFTPGMSLVVDPTAPATLYLTTNTPNSPNIFFRSTNTGASWSATPGVTTGDSVFTAAARPAGSGLPAAIFAANQNLIRSTDHGASWTLVNAKYSPCSAAMRGR